MPHPQRKLLGFTFHRGACCARHLKSLQIDRPRVAASLLHAWGVGSPLPWKLPCQCRDIQEPKNAKNTHYLDVQWMCVCVLCLCIIIFLFCMTQISCLCLCPFCLGWPAVGREKCFTYKNYVVLLGFKLTILGTCWNSLVSDLLATLVPFSFTIRSRDISGFFQFRHEFPVLQGEKCESPTANCTRKKPSLLRVGYIFFRVGYMLFISS